jgi:hypothetical protein
MQNIFPFLAFLLLATRLEAQLPVDRDPHHKVIKENPYFRLLEGKIPTGDTTPAHVHAANSVVVFLSHSTFGIQVIGDKPVIATVNPGDLRYLAYGDKPVNHIVWNQSSGLFHFYVVELAKKPVIKDIANNQSVYLQPTASARLLIYITGIYKFIPPNTPLDLRNPARCILLDIN